MNVRLKKEFQAHFWPWLVAMLLGLLPIVSWMFPTDQFEESFRGIYTLSGAAFVLGIVLLGALPFGEELNLRTLPMLLSQPVTRWEIWREKFRIAFLHIASVTMVYVISYLPFIGLIKNELKVICAFLIFSLCSATFWTLLARSTIGGAVLCLASQSVLMLLAYAFTEKKYFTTGVQQMSSATEQFLLIASLILSPLFLWLGWLLFSRMQLANNWDGTIDTLAPEKATVRKASWFRARPSSPLRNLVFKELRMYGPIFVMTFLFACLWIAVVFVHQAMPQKHTMLSNLLNGFTLIYIPLVVLVSGCISLGEEKSLGLHHVNLTLPVSIRMQWFIKITAASIIGVVGGLVLPVLLVKLENLISDKMLDTVITKILGEEGIFVVICLMFPLVITVSFWAMTVLNRTIHAAFLAGFSLLVVVLFHTIGKNLEYGLDSFTAGLVDWFTVQFNQPLGWAGKYSAEIFFLSFAFIGLPFPLLSWLAYQQRSNSRTAITITVSAIAVMSWFSGASSADILQSSREQYLESSRFHQEPLAALRAIGADVWQPNLKGNLNFTADILVQTRCLSPLTAKWLKGARITIHQSTLTTHPSGETIRYIEVAIHRQDGILQGYSFRPKTGLPTEVPKEK